MSLRPDLDAEARIASHNKVTLGMDMAERQRLMDVLLRISQIALAAFDVLDSDKVSEHDVFVMLQLPDYCNAFSDGITRHAIAKGARLPIRGGSMSTDGEGTNDGR